MHKTSLNVSSKIFHQLQDTSTKFKISKKDLIFLILLKCRDNLDYSQHISGLTAYQKKLSGDSWKCLRTDFDDSQCDFYFFYRNRFRISLSRLFSICFVLFFDSILNELQMKNKIKNFIKIRNSYTELKEIFWPVIANTLFIFKQTCRNTT